MKIIITLITSVLLTATASAQHIYLCKSADISFYSSAPIEDIEARTQKGVSAVNLQTGAIYFKVGIRSFEFDKSLMQQHFNSDYMESDQYPFAEFKGKLVDFTLPDSDGVYPVTVAGTLTIHGVSKNYKTSGSLDVRQGQLTAVSAFKVRLADHQIKIPALLFQNIAEVVDVKVKAVYAPQQGQPAGAP